MVGSLLFPAAGAAQSGQAARLHDMINSHREEIGCTPLAWHGIAATVAAARSADMHERRYFDHVAPDGRNVFHELADAGIAARGSIAENIALTQAGPSSVMELWIESPPHRRNIDDCAFTHEALAVRAGLWTQILLDRPMAATSLARPVAADSPSDRATPRP
jgi:uncharacterized protein YkwD